MSSQDSSASQVTISTLLRAKQAGEKFACLTAYDASFARILDKAEIDVILVGDSLGMVVQGRATTVPVSMDDMVYHSRLVARGCERALLMADMPFMSFASPAEAATNAARLMQEGGAHMVKLEGGAIQLSTVEYLSDRGVPVCAHLGLQPQSIHQLGGYRVQGREDAAARAMLEDAARLEQAGAATLLLECVPSQLAAEISAAASVPVIGIGAGPACDGQILVLYDMLGIAPGKRLRFSHDFLADTGSVAAAVAAYAAAVKGGSFPTPEHGFE